MSSYLIPTISYLLRATGITSNTTINLPAGYVIERVYIRNNTANTITGGVRVGTTDGGVDIVLALAVGANVTVDTASLISAISAANQTLYIQAVTLWNSANIDIVIKVTKVF